MRSKAFSYFILICLVLATAQTAEARPFGRASYGLFGGLRSFISRIFGGRRGGGGGGGGGGVEGGEGADGFRNGAEQDTSSDNESHANPTEVSNDPVDESGEISKHASPSEPAPRSRARTASRRPVAEPDDEIILADSKPARSSAPRSMQEAVRRPASDVSADTVERPRVAEPAEPKARLTVKNAERPVEKEKNRSYGYDVHEVDSLGRPIVGKCQFTPSKELPGDKCIAYTAYHCVALALARSRNGTVQISQAQLGQKPVTVKVVRSQDPELGDIAALEIPGCTKDNFQFTPIWDTALPKGTPLQWASYWRGGLYAAQMAGSKKVELGGGAGSIMGTVISVVGNAAGVLQGDSGGGLFVTVGGTKYLVAVLSAADFRRMNARGSNTGIYTRIAGMKKFNQEIDRLIAQSSSDSNSGSDSGADTITITRATRRPGLLYQ